MARMRHGDARRGDGTDAGGRAGAQRVTIDMIDGRTGTALMCPDDAMDDKIFVHDLRLDDGTELDAGWIARGVSLHKSHFMILEAAE